MAEYNNVYFTYDFNFHVSVDHDWFNEINFNVNNGTVRDSGSAAYINAYNEAEEIKYALQAMIQGGAPGNWDAPGAAAEAQQAVTCPSCGAVTMPDANGCCEYCGSPVNG